MLQYAAELLAYAICRNLVGSALRDGALMQIQSSGLRSTLSKLSDEILFCVHFWLAGGSLSQLSEM